MPTYRKYHVPLPAPHVSVRFPGNKSNTYPLFQFRDFNRDEIGLVTTLQLIEPSLVLDQLAKQERQEFFVVLRLRQVLPESLQKHKKPLSAMEEEEAEHSPSATSA
jgi:hypothetical protein